VTGEGVEARDAARPQIRGDDVFAKVELRAARTDEASGIDQQGAVLPGDEQTGIALAHVDGSYNIPGRVRGVSPDQMHNAFQVVGLRKQIHQVNLLGAIARAKQGHKIARQRCRIARHINNAWRSQGRQ
jgi:hypothetical protein